MLCRGCGADIPDDSQVCPHCGQALQAADHGAQPAHGSESSTADLTALAIDRFHRAQSPPEPFTAWKSIAAIGAVMVLLAAASIGTYYFTRRSSNLAEIVELSRPAPTTDITRADPSPSPAQPTAPAPTTAGAATPGAADMTSSVNVASVQPAAIEAQSGSAQANAPPAPKHKTAKSAFKAEFKGMFGQVVDTRTYPSRKMRRKARELWQREGKILEPNGSIYDPYMRPPSSPSPIPGH